jgi:hypothetical protein
MNKRLEKDVKNHIDKFTFDQKRALVKKQRNLNILLSSKCSSSINNSGQTTNQYIKE